MSRTLQVDDGRIQREVILVGTMLVGRDPECEISHADPRLSRRHAEFRVTAEGVRLRDLGSRNGTHVNGRIVEEVVLTTGDVVQIAHLTIRFSDKAANRTVHMSRGASQSAAAPNVQDDRTRVVSPAQRSAAQLATAVGIHVPALDDRSRMQPTPVTRASDNSLPAVRVAGSVRASARLTQTTEVISALPISDVGEVVIREASAEPRRPLRPVDLSVHALGSTAWGRRVLLQGLALAALVLLLTAAPLLAWEVRLYGTSALSSWPVLLPVVAAALLAGVTVASLIARTTAQGLSSQGR